MDCNRSRRDVLRALGGGLLAAGASTTGIASSLDAEGRTAFVYTDDVYAIDAATGEVRWTFGDLFSGDSSPTVVDGVLFVGSGGGDLYRIDAATGEAAWAFEEPGDDLQSSPTVVDGTVYVGSDDGALYAVDAVDGEAEWTYDRPDGDVRSSPSVVDGLAYVGDGDGVLHAVDVDTGRREWTFDDPAAIRSSPTAVGGTVYVGDDDGNLYAVDASSGTLEWSRDLPSWIRSSPTVVDGTVYVSLSGLAGRSLRAFDASSGDEEWTFDAPSTRVRSSPTVADGTVYVGDDDGILYAVDADSGSEQWRFEGADDEIRSSPTVADGTVYVGDGDGVLHAVDASSGTEEWSVSPGVLSIESGPTVVEDPSSGHSSGSRVALGTLGHHHEWAGDSSQEIAAPSQFVVSGLDPEDPVVEIDDDALLVSAVVENPSDRTVRESLELRVGGSEVDGTTEVLDGGESSIPAFELDPSRFEVGEYEYGVYGEHDEDVGTLTVRESAEPAEFEVSSLEPEDYTAEYDEIVEVTADVVNVGDLEGETDVELWIDGLTVVVTSIDLAGGESETVEFPIDAGELEADTYELTIATVDHTAGTSLTVQSEPEAAAFEIVDVAPVDPTVDHDGTLDVTAVVANVGDQSAEAVVELDVDSATVDAESVTLDGGEEVDVALSADASDLEAGEYEYIVRIEDDAVTVPFAVEEPPADAEFVVEGVVQGNVSVEAGEVIELGASVRNEGDVQDERSVDLRIDGDVVDETELQLSGGEVDEVQFEVDTSVFGPGEYEYAIHTTEHAAVATLTVVDPDGDGEPVGDDDRESESTGDDRGSRTATDDDGIVTTISDPVVSGGALALALAGGLAWRLKGDDGSPTVDPGGGSGGGTTSSGTASSGTGSGPPNDGGDVGSEDSDSDRAPGPTAGPDDDATGPDADAGVTDEPTASAGGSRTDQGSTGADAPSSPDAAADPSDDQTEASLPEGGSGATATGAGAADSAETQSEAGDSAVGDDSAERSCSDSRGGIPVAAPDPSTLEEGIHEASDVEFVETFGPLAAYTVRFDGAGPDRVRLLTTSTDVDDAALAFRETVGQWGKLSQYDGAVSVYEFGDSPRPWAATDLLVDGTTLAAFDEDAVLASGLERDPEPVARLDPVLDCAVALKQAGRYGIRHYALSPEVVWVRETDDGLAGVVDDWGLRVAIENERSDSPYTPPELRPDSDESPWQDRPDVYGLGALAYLAATGREPPADPEATDPPSELADVPRAVDDPILTALSASHDDRQNSVSVFERELRRALE